jgi:TRAP-type C4-dicarboxylate transport system permease small subunit
MVSERRMAGRRLLRLIDAVTAITRILLIAVGCLLVAVVLAEIAARQLFDYSLVFADELARYLFIWSAFLGASLALRRGQHIGLELAVHAGSRVLRLLVHGCVAIFLLVLLYASTALLPLMWDQNTTLLGVRMVWVFLALPVGAVLMLIQLVALVVETLHPVAGDLDGAVAPVGSPRP